jgi:hypothetical protein
MTGLNCSPRFIAALAKLVRQRLVQCAENDGS